MVTAADAANAPTVIRIGSPDLGTAQKPFPGGNALAVAKTNGWLDEELKKDGIKIEWSFFRGAGPAVNEALSGKKLDVVFLGDLAAVIGRSAGLPTRLIVATGRNSNVYLGVHPDSGIKTFADLKGRKVSVLKGTAYQRPFDRLLADAGLKEKDLKLINLDWPTSKAAVVNRDVDATFGGADIFLLKEKGIQIPVSTKGLGPGYTVQAGVLATEDFITQYPEITTRLVKQIVRAAHWASDEKNRDKLFDTWSQASGLPEAIFRNEFDGESLKARNSPRLDESLIYAYKGVVAEGLKLGLIRQPVDVDAWIAPQFVNQAIKQLKLESYWTALDRNGQPVKP